MDAGSGSCLLCPSRVSVYLRTAFVQAWRSNFSPFGQSCPSTGSGLWGGEWYCSGNVGYSIGSRGSNYNWSRRLLPFSVSTFGRGYCQRTSHLISLGAIIIRIEDRRAAPEQCFTLLYPTHWYNYISKIPILLKLPDIAFVLTDPEPMDNWLKKVGIPGNDPWVRS